MNRFYKKGLAFLLAVSMIIGDFMPAAAAALPEPDENMIISEAAEEAVEPEEGIFEETEIPAEDPLKEAPEEESLTVEETVPEEESLTVEETAPAESVLYAAEAKDAVWALMYTDEDDICQVELGFPSYAKMVEYISKHPEVFEDKGGLLHIGYYPENEVGETSPMEVLPAEFFTKCREWGVQDIIISKHVQDITYGWFLYGFGNRGQDKVVPLSLTIKHKIDAAELGTGKQIKVTYGTASLPACDMGYLAIKKENIISEVSKKDNELYLYVRNEEDGQLIPCESISLDEKKDMLFFPVEWDGEVIQKSEFIFLDTYRGRLSKEETETRLQIGYWEVSEELSAEAWRELVLTALQSYNPSDEAISCVGLDFRSGKNNVIDAEIVKEAAKLLDPAYENRRIDYVFFNESTSQAVNWTLDKPFTDASQDIEAAVTVTPVKHTGVKIKLAATDFPAESVSLNIWKDRNPELKEAFAYAEAFGSDREETNTDKELRVFSMSSGNVTGVMDCGGRYERNDPNNMDDWSDGFHVWGVSELEAGKEYLVAPYTEAVGEGEAIVTVGDTKQLSVAGQSKVTWKSLTPKLAVTDSKGVLTALNEGEAWVSAKYSSGLTIYRLEIGRAQCELEFKRKSMTMDAYRIEWSWDEENDQPKEEKIPAREYLDVRFYPSDAGRDPAELEWTVEDDKVVKLVRREDEEGRPGSYDGTIEAVSPGTTKVTAKLLDEAGNEVTSAVCTVTVKEPEENLLDGVDYPDVYAVTHFDSKLSDVHFRERTDYEPTLKKLLHQTGSLSGTYKDGTIWIWEWKNPNTSLSAYKKMDGASFPAVYTEIDQYGNEKSQETELWVRMVSISAIVMGALVDQYGNPDPNGAVSGWPKQMQVGETMYPGFYCEVENGLPLFSENGYLSAWELYPYWYKESGNPYGPLQAFWMSDAMALLDRDWWTGAYYYKAEDPGTKLKSFSIRLIDANTNKQILKTTSKLQVTKNPLAEFLDVYTYTGTAKDAEELKLPLIEGQQYLVVCMSPGSGFKSAKSADTSVAAIGTGVISHTFLGDVGVYEAHFIPYTEKKPGTSVITITSADEMKTSTTYTLHVVDREPKLANDSMEINRAWENPDGLVSIRFREDYPLAEGGIQLTGNIQVKNGKTTKSVPASEYFEIFKDEDGSTASLYRGRLTVRNRELPDGTYTIELAVPVDVSKDIEEQAVESLELTDPSTRNYILKIKVKVTSKVPAVTIKQTRKVNVFYKGGSCDEAGDGIFTITAAGGAAVWADRIIDLKDGTSVRYSLYRHEEDDFSNEYRVYWDMNQESEKTKGILVYKLPGYVNLSAEEGEDGYSDEFEKPVTIQTEYKKPVLVLSAKSDTLYPGLNCKASAVRVLNKSTGEEIELTEENVTDRGKQKYNTFQVSVNPGEEDRGVLLFTLASDKAILYGKTDKLSVGVKENTWRDYVDVAYSIKVDKSTSPKLKLSSSTIILNKNDEIFESQEAYVDLRFSGCSNHLPVWNGEDETYTDVRFTGADAKSNKVLNSKHNSLILEYWQEEGKIVARFNDNKLDKGKYKFNVWVESRLNNGIVKTYQASTVLTIEVKDEAPEKCVSASVKGSIDVLRRDTTFLTVTTKLNKNLQGEIIGCRLEGQDSWRFQKEDGGSGIFYIRASEFAFFSTKDTYKLTLALELENYGRRYEVFKDLSIKVTQGSPKLTLTWLEGDTIYRQLSNELNENYVGNHLELELRAAIGNEEIQISSVELLSYRRDFWLYPWFLLDIENFYWSYNPETGTVLLNNEATVETLKNGKYTLKFAVYYKDQADNTKVQEVKTTINLK